MYAKDISSTLEACEEKLYSSINYVQKGTLDIVLLHTLYCSIWSLEIY